MPIRHAIIHVMHVTFCRERKEIVKNLYKCFPPSYTFFYPDAPRTSYYFLTEIKAKDLGSQAKSTSKLYSISDPVWHSQAILTARNFFFYLTHIVSGKCSWQTSCTGWDHLLGWNWSCSLLLLKLLFCSLPILFPLTWLWPSSGT